MEPKSSTPWETVSTGVSAPSTLRECLFMNHSEGTPILEQPASGRGYSTPWEYGPQGVYNDSDGEEQPALERGYSTLFLEKVTSEMLSVSGRNIFREIDVSGDGFLQRLELDEWWAANREWALQNGITPAFFDSLDVDGGGKVSAEEFAAWSMRLHRKFGTSDDTVTRSIPPANDYVPSSLNHSPYGAVRFIGHNKYLYGCFSADDDGVKSNMQASFLFSLEEHRHKFAFPDHSPRFCFADGTQRGNFLLQVDNFVSQEEAQKVIQAGCYVKRKLLGTVEQSNEYVDSEGKFGRQGSALPIARTGTIAFDEAYATGWVFLARAREWLPQEILEENRRWKLKGVNPRIRLVHYDTSGQGFDMHFDSQRWGLESEVDDLNLPITAAEVVNGADAEEVGQHTFLTMNLYLNDAREPDTTFGGGRIICYSPSSDQKDRTWTDNGAEMTQSELRVCGEPPLSLGFRDGLPIEPATGRMLIFGQGRLGGIMHEAEAVSCSHNRMEDQKWILRADVTYTIVKS